MESYLRECVDSVLAQEMRDIEVILVDDGSPDSCGKICDEYANQDERVRVIHKENGGVSTARNAGLEAAKGEYIAFVDADDYALPDYVSRLYSAAKKSGADFVVCGIFQETKNAKKERIAFGRQEIFFENNDALLAVFAKLRVSKKPESAVLLHSPFNKLYKSNLLNGVSFDKEIKLGEDYLFNLKIFSRAQNALFIPDNLYVYRWNPTSATKKYDTLQFVHNHMQLISHTNEFFRSHKLKMTSAEIYGARCFRGIVASISRLAFEDADKEKGFSILESIETCFDKKFIFRSFFRPQQFLILMLFALKKYNALFRLYAAKEKFRAFLHCCTKRKNPLQ